MERLTCRGLHARIAGYRGQLVRASCLFPDPWAQQRFRRRRLLQPELVALVAGALAEGGEFVTASDNRELAEEMRAHLARPSAELSVGVFWPERPTPPPPPLPLRPELTRPLFSVQESCGLMKPAEAGEGEGCFLPASPFPVATEWECTAAGRSSPMYWSRFVKGST